MNYWLDAAVWKDFWKPPPLTWWLTPSGGDTQTSWGDFVIDILMESPVGAHLFGSGIAFLIGFLVTQAKWEAFGFAVVWAVIGQLQKADALIPLRRYNMRNVFWRILIGTVPLLALLLVL